MADPDTRPPTNTESPVVLVDLVKLRADLWQAGFGTNIIGIVLEAITAQEVDQ